MNCLFLLVLLCCCGNNNRSRSGCGSGCHMENHNDCGCMRSRQEERGCDRECGRSNNNRRHERSDEGRQDGCGCEERMQSRSMSRYDDSMRGQGNADTVPGMSRSVMNGYAAYQDSCGCGE